MKTIILSRIDLNDCQEANGNYYYNNATKRKENNNSLFVDNVLGSLGEYLILPALIHRNFEKFIMEFYSVQLSVKLKGVKQQGPVFIVTVWNIKEKKYEKIVWYLRNHFRSKTINVNIIKSLKHSLKKYSCNAGVIVSTTSILSHNSIKLISNCKYDIYFIDKKILNKHRTYSLWQNFGIDSSISGI